MSNDIADVLSDEHDVDVYDLADSAEILCTSDLTIVVCSTHGEGDLPQRAVPFVQALTQQGGALGSMVYAMFGLGDSSYPNYSKGSEHVDTILRERGATRIGEYGRHDAASRDDPSELGIEWARSVIEEFLSSEN